MVQFSSFVFVFYPLRAIITDYTTENCVERALRSDMAIERC